MDLDALKPQLRADLTRERPLTDAVRVAIVDQFSLLDPAIPAFFQDTVQTLDEDVLDLLFSPLFTPTTQDRLPYAALLGGEAVAEADLNALVDALAAEGLVAPLVSSTGEQFALPLQTVTIARFVQRLRLDRAVSAPVLAAISECVPAADQAEVNMLARESVWQSPKRAGLLVDFLRVFAAGNRYSREKVVYLTDFVRTYRPDGVAAMDRQLDNVVSACESDLANLSGRSFHDSHLKEKYMARMEGHHHDAKHAESSATTYLRLMAQAKDLKIDVQQLLPVAQAG